MAVTVAGSRKRGLANILDSAFLDDPLPLPSHHLAKRGRCSSAAASAADLGVSLDFDPVEVLQLVFPHEDPQHLQNCFQASGNVLDAAIKRYKDHLQYASGDKGKDVFSPKVAYDSSSMSIPSTGSQWAELVVKEMSSALDLVDAKNRAFKILDLFEKATGQCTSPDVIQKMHEEHKILKSMLGGLLEQNGFLKRAFLKQHNLLNDCEKISQERLQIIDQYKKENDALKQRNLVLEFQLAQMNQHNNITGHCNPNVF